MALTGRRPLPMVLESANIRFNQTTDYIEVLNPYTNQWEEWQKSGVIFEGTNIVVTTKNLNGKVVTCTINNESYTATFVGGSATFTVYSPGTATVACEGLTAQVTVAEGETSVVDISRAPATLKLTTTNLNAKTVTVQIAGVTYTGIFANNEYTFTVYEVGTATITCDTVKVTQVIESGKSYTVELIKPFAVLDLTTSEMDGYAVKVVVGGQIYNGSFSGGKCRFTLYEFGIATITCGYAEVTQEIASGGTYTVNITKPFATINLTTTNLNGHTVTATVNGATYSGIFANGKATITVYEFGSATVKSTGVSKTLTVAKGGTYNVDLVRPYATVTVSTSNLKSHAVTLTVGGVNYSGTFSASGSYTFTVYEFGSATISSTNASTTITIESGKSYTPTLNRPQAVLNFTTDDLNGKTITVKINGNTYNATFSGYVASLTLYEFGSATITCGYDTATQTVTSGQTYNITLNRPKCLINLNSTTLQNQPVTVTVGGNTYKGTFSSSGTCNITVYDVFGTATITSTNASTTLAVAEGGTYTKTLNRPSAKINLTTSNLQNQTITFSVDGGSTQQTAFGSDGTLTLTVYVFGTYTFTCSQTSKSLSVAGGGTYTLDLTEFVKVTFYDKGTFLNGCTSKSGSNITIGTQANGTYDGYKTIIGNGSSIDWSTFAIPKTRNFIGHTFYIKVAKDYIWEVDFYYRYGNSSDNLYVKFNRENITGGYEFTLTLTEEMFNNGYAETHYIGCYCQEGKSVVLTDMYVE